MDYIESYGDARFTCTTDDTRLHGERSGYWRDTHDGRQWLFTGAGLKQAVKGYDIKQVENILKQEGWITPDKQGKTKHVVNIKNNESGESRLYVITPKSDGNTGNTLEKTGVTAASRVIIDGNTSNT